MKTGGIDTKKKSAKSAPAKLPETMMLEDSALGDIKIHEGVIASLARRAALNVEGVSRLAGNLFVDNIAEIVGSRRMQSRAITITMNETSQVAIELKINLKFGFRIPEVAEKVQKAVISEVESVTGMTVRSVSVLVQEVEDPLPVAPADSESEPDAEEPRN